jgi:hypothetical protein
MCSTLLSVLAVASHSLSSDESLSLARDHRSGLFWIIGNVRVAAVAPPGSAGMLFVSVTFADTSLVRLAASSSGLLEGGAGEVDIRVFASLAVWLPRRRSLPRRNLSLNCFMLPARRWWSNGELDVYDACLRRKGLGRSKKKKQKKANKRIGRQATGRGRRWTKNVQHWPCHSGRSASNDISVLVLHRWGGSPSRDGVFVSAAV